MLFPNCANLALFLQEHKSTPSPLCFIEPTSNNKTLTMSHYQVDAEGDIAMMDADSSQPRHIAIPRPRLGGIVKNLSTVFQTVRPVVEPTFCVISGGIQQGVKRSSESAINYCSRLLTGWIDPHHSRDDNLTVKRFKRLPLNPNKATNPFVERPDALPVEWIKALPKGHFKWTDQPLAYLGENNHATLINFIGDFIMGIQANNYCSFDGIGEAVDPLNVPQEISEELQRLAKNEPLSVVLHNYMMKERLEQDTEIPHLFTTRKIWKSLEKFREVHEQMYGKHGRLAILKAYGRRPYGPIDFPYDSMGQSSLQTRCSFLDCVNLLRFLLSQRDAFRNMFPVETAVGIIADIDAAHKDELPPSYVDWPGKYQESYPGTFPDDTVDRLLFETVSVEEFNPTRKWDHDHLSPGKHITAADYDTPRRNAVRKNEIYYDSRGRPRAVKSHLRPENTRPAQRKQVKWMSGNVAYYQSSDNVPLPKREVPPPSSPVDRELTPPPSSPVSHAPIETAASASPSTAIPLVLEANTAPATVAAPTADAALPAIISSTAITGSVSSPDLTAEVFPAAAPPPVMATSSVAIAPPASFQVPTAPLVVMQQMTPQAAQQPAEEPTEEQREVRTFPIRSEQSMIEELAKIHARKPRSTKPKWKTLDDFFSHDDKGLFGRLRQMNISSEKAVDLEIREQLEQDGILRAKCEAERIAKEKLRLEEEANLRAEEERRLAEQREQEAEDRRLAESGELRAPHRSIIPDLSVDWTDKAMHTLQARNNAELAKSPDGTVLQRKDFVTVVTQNQWLNDEIVNATLLHLGNYVNQKAGIKNTRVRTPKIQIFNSFVGKNLDDGRPPTERMLRRAGIRRENFLDIETILFPLCRGSHWTIVAVRPKHRQIHHLDSLNSRRDQALVNKVNNWIRGVLGDDYIESEWKADTLASPRQSNMDDCGVHTITNGICIGLGIKPSSYSASMMPTQRLHLAAVLLNGGFDNEFTLDGI